LPDLQKRYSIVYLGIFGSYVRGEQTAESDVDILIEFSPNLRLGLLTFCEIENYLSDQLEIKVDLVEKTALKPQIGQQISPMTSKRSFKDYLQDMLVAAEDAMQFVAGMDFTTFEQDKRTTYAVIRAIEITRP